MTARLLLAWTAGLGLLSLSMLAQQPTPSAPAGPPPVPVRGTLDGETTWSGAVLLEGDVTVAAGGRLVVRAGTRIVVAKEDALHAGWDERRVELHVLGRLELEGNLEQPIVIGPQSATDNAGTTRKDWYGIVLHAQDGQPSRDKLQGFSLGGAFAGLQLLRSVRIEDAVFRGNTTCAEVGVAYRDDRFSAESADDIAPEFTRCRFADSIAGVYAQGSARPEFTRCVFYKLRAGAGSYRDGYSSWLSPPGCSLRWCAVVDTEVGVQGSAVVHDSIFAGVTAAIELSQYHDAIATSIDQVALADCLVAGDAVVVRGDSGAARAVLRGEPGFAGPLRGLRAAWPPLPAALQLTPGSPAIGAAHDGSDLGPMFAERRDRATSRWRDGLVPLTVWSVAAAARTEAGAVGKFEPGAPFGDSWWVAARADDQGELSLRALLGRGDGTAVFGAAIVTADAGKRRLLVSADAAALEIGCNGVVVGRYAGRRRNGVPFAVDLPLRAGRNAVSVRVTGWGTDPRFCAALAGAFEPAPWAAAASPPAVVGSKLGRERDERFVDLTFDTAPSWIPAAGQDLARLRRRDPGDPTSVLEARWLGPLRLRLGPLPADVVGGSVAIELPGLCDVHGAAVSVPSVSVEVK